MEGVCGKGHLGVGFLRVSMCAERMGYGGVGYMGNSRKRDCQWVSRNVFEDFTEDFGSLFRTGTALMLKAHW